MKNKITKKSKSKISLPSREITKETKISEIVNSKPEAVEILFGAGMSCIGCPMAQQETLEEGCKAHGMSDKEIKKLVEKFNGK